MGRQIISVIMESWGAWMNGTIFDEIDSFLQDFQVPKICKAMEA